MTPVAEMPKRESSKKGKIDARMAARAAAEYFKHFYPEVSAFSLEEVELSDDEKHWLITLSFEIRPSGALPSLSAFQPPKMKFKIFTVDAKTGRVTAMKIRQLD